MFQRLDSRYVLRRQTRRLMLAGGRFVHDERPGIAITERVGKIVLPVDKKQFKGGLSLWTKICSRLNRLMSTGW